MNKTTDLKRKNKNLSRRSFLGTVGVATTAFAIILSAVGAVVAMLQRSDEERRRSIKELKCLYDIGKAAEESD